MQAEHGIKIDYSTGLITEYILVLLIALFTVLHISRGVSICFSATFFVFALISIQYLTQCRISLTMLFLLLFAFLNVAINALISRQAQIGFAYFRKLIMFFCTVVLLYAAVNMKIEERGRRAVVCLPILIGLILTASYYLLGNRGLIAGSITLGFVNPNFAGIWLTHVLFYSVYALVDSRRVWVKFLCMALGIICIILIYLTYARSCFAGILVFLVLVLAGLLLRQNIISKPVALAVAVFPIVFAIIYLALINVDWLTDFFSFLVRTGKKLNARNKLWLLALQSARANPLFGNYSGISGGAGISQLHNTHIDILASYGVVPLILYIASLYGVMKKASERIRSFSQYVALCAFIGIVAIGAFEAALVAGSTGLYLLSGGFLILATTQPWQTAEPVANEQPVEFSPPGAAE